MTNSSWVANAQYSRYAKIALESFNKAHASYMKLYNLQEDDNLANLPDAYILRDEVIEQCAISLTFAVMAHENYLNVYLARSASKSFADKIDKLSLVTKWKKAIYQNEGLEIDGETIPFKVLTEVVKSRNLLIHSKANKIQIDSDGQLPLPAVLLDKHYMNPAYAALYTLWCLSDWIECNLKNTIGPIVDEEFEYQILKEYLGYPMSWTFTTETILF